MHTLLTFIPRELTVIIMGSAGSEEKRGVNSSFSTTIKNEMDDDECEVDEGSEYDVLHALLIVFNQ